MGGRHWDRWLPASGIVYAALFLVATILTSDSPDTGDSDQTILSYYADGGHRTRQFVAIALVAVAVLFFLWFVSVLRDRLRAIEPESGGLSALALAAGVSSATLLMGALAFAIAVPATIADTDRFTLDANTYRLFDNASYGLLVGSTMVASVLVAPTSVLALRTAALPRWLGWIGLVVALVLLFAVFFFPLFALWAWVVVISVVLIARPREHTSQA
jgi:hypothetical protein